MGSGSWTTKALDDYTYASRGVSTMAFASMDNLSAQEVYRSRRLDAALNPKNVMRECCDSDEHPNTLPVILALDVTGSMGGSAVKVAQKLNDIMTDLYADDNVPDIEFCIMGIGDLAYDSAPIQISQFESDVRIAEQLDKIYFERGGGGNSYESYTAAWYMGVNHCKLDCWNRGQKGIIITLGDELPNPHLPANTLAYATGDKVQGDVETKDLYPQVTEKFDVFHISVQDSDSSYDWNNRRNNLDEAWANLIGEDHYFVSGLNDLTKTIVSIVSDHANGSIPVVSAGVTVNESGEVSW